MQAKKLIEHLVYMQDKDKTENIESTEDMKDLKDVEGLENMKLIDDTVNTVDMQDMEVRDLFLSLLVSFSFSLPSSTALPCRCLNV